MEWAPASDGQAFEKFKAMQLVCSLSLLVSCATELIRIGGLKDSTMQCLQIIANSLLEHINHEGQSAHALSCLTTGPQHNLSHFMMHISWSYLLIAVNL